MPAPRILLALSLLALGAGSGPAGAADAVADFYAGKQISLLIGTTTGGGYDAYGRLVARHMGKHIPGHPDILAKNMPGADGLLLANYVYNRSPRDGSEFGTFANGAAFEKLFQTLSPGGSNALFDAAKFGWIGSATQSIYLTVTWHESPTKTIADAQVKKTILGSSGTGSDSYVLAMLMNRMLGTKFEVVHGYDGATAVDIAMERGEVQGQAGKDWSTVTATRPYWLSEKKVNVLIQLGLKARPEIPEVPLMLDLVKSAEDRRIAELIFAKHGMARPYTAPPEIPPDRLGALRRAFDATLRDDAFLAEAAKARMEIIPVSGEEVQALVTRIMTSPEELAVKARAALKP